ncbi:MAG: sugar nucleotide-binding protein [Pseudomonadales bacterium]
MNVLLLGAEHRVARELVALLPEIGCTVESVDLPGLDESLNAELIGRVGAAVADLVVFTPQIPLSRLSFRRRLHLVDVVKKLCVAVAGKNKPFIHVSSALVFDGKLSRAYREDDKPSPRSDLAKVWRRWETIVQSQFDKHVVLRAAWLLGRNEAYISSELKQTLGYHAAPDKVLEAIGNPISPVELARVIAAIIRQIQTGAENFGVFHVGSKEAISTARVLESVAPESYLRIDDQQNALSFELDCQKMLNNFGVQKRAW